MTLRPFRPRDYEHVRQTHDGYSYDSRLEAQFAAYLDTMKELGEIVSWERQVTLDLRVNDQHVANYKIDFVVTYPDGEHEYVEVKGFENEVWLLKRRVLEATLPPGYRFRVVRG